MLSVSLMCFGSLMIAVTPTYANIGVAAPVAFFPFSGWKDSFLGDLHAHVMATPFAMT